MNRLLVRSSMVAALLLAVATGATAQAGQTVTGGAREIWSLNFATVPIGDFPSRKDLSTKSSLEVVDNNGVHMLKAELHSDFVIKLPENLPELFTLEFDVVSKECCDLDDLSFETMITD